MNDLPNFSVVLSIYNGDKLSWVAEAIDSIFNQSVAPNEIIVVLDGPIRADLRQKINLLSNYKEIRVLENSSNKGLGFSRHKAIMNANNEIIAFMDADDVSVFDRFERQLTEILSKGVDVLGGLIEEFDESLKGGFVYQSCARE